MNQHFSVFYPVSTSTASPTTSPSSPNDEQQLILRNSSNSLQTKTPSESTSQLQYSEPESSETVIVKGVQQVVNTAQVKFNDYIYNVHDNYVYGRDYRCNRYKALKCPAKLKVKFSDDDAHAAEVWYHTGEHIHPPGDISKTVKPLNEKRREQLYDFIVQNPSMGSQLVANMLNRQIPSHMKQKPEFWITKAHVQAAKNAVVYTPRITNFQDLYTRKELRETIDGQTFIQNVTLYPHFLLLYASPFQLNILKHYHEQDQLYMDGTFEICSEGLQQMVTLYIQRANEKVAHPVMFAFLQEKTQLVYEHMWQKLLELVPELKRVNKVYMALDFEKAMHNATLKYLSNTELICCFFHMQQAVTCWIEKNGNLETNENIEGIWADLRTLAGQDHGEGIWAMLKQYYESWLECDNKFALYMKNTYLTKDSSFPPHLWCFSLRTRKIDIEVTDNNAEQAHQRLHKLFRNSPDLKQMIEILQQVEKEVKDTLYIDTSSAVGLKRKRAAEQSMKVKNTKRSGGRAAKKQRTNEPAITSFSQEASSLVTSQNSTAIISTSSQIATSTAQQSSFMGLLLNSLQAPSTIAPAPTPAAPQSTITSSMPIVTQMVPTSTLQSIQQLELLQQAAKQQQELQMLERWLANSQNLSK